jgi:lysophospholipase L1-like esterase
MKHDLQFWKPFFQGTITQEIIDDKLILNRFTQEQTDIIGAKNDHFAERMKCYAGVSLAMCGKLSTIKLTAILEAQVDISAHGSWCIDVIVDDVVKHSRAYTFDENNSDNWSDEFELGEPGTYKVVEILLPHIARLNFTSIEVDSEVTPINDERGLYLAIGDSITQGMGSRRPWMTYPQQVSRALDKKLINQGIGGYIFDADGIDLNIELEPELITIAYGINDLWRGYKIEEIEFACDCYYKKIRERWSDVPIYTITPIWCNKQVDPKSSVVIADPMEFRSSIAKMGGKYNITPINGLEMMPHEPPFLPDTLHPNEEGYMIYSSNLTKVLQP